MRKEQEIMDRIGKYRIIRPLGKGGEGRVFLVMHEQTQQLWAMKVIGKCTFRGEADREIRMLRRLHHPNLPAVIDVLETEDKICLVLEYIRGSSVEEMLKKRGRIGTEQILWIGRQLCDAVQYLHSQDPPLLHLDLKPANLIMTREGRLVLVDFGAAQKMDGTRVKRKGTDGFAAPEQFDEEAVLDERTDVYGIGAVLYCMAAGRRYDASRKDIHTGTCPEDLRSVLAVCLQVCPEDRYQSVSRLKTALYKSRVRSLKSRGRIRFGLASLVMIFSCSILVRGVSREMGQAASVSFSSQKLLEDAACAPEEERKSLYLKALFLEPAGEEIYLQLMEEIMFDGIMEKEEEDLLRTLLYTVPFGKQQTYEELLAEEPCAYAKVCFQIGLAYWYGYSGEEIEGKRIALGWFEKVNRSAAGTETDEPPWLRGARFYIRMGSFLRSGISGEAYWQDLTALLETDLNEMLSVQMQLTFIADSLGQLTVYLQQILAGGVSPEEINACAQKLIFLAENLPAPEGTEEYETWKELKDKTEQAAATFGEVFENTGGTNVPDTSG